MAISQARSKKKVSGSKYIDFRKKRTHELGRDPTYTKVGATKTKQIRGRGGVERSILLSADILNLYNPKTKKHEKVKIQNVVDNQANRNFVRRNIITKGTIVQTEKGKARILNKPGKEGSLNAILVE